MLKVFCLRIRTDEMSKRSSSLLSPLVLPKTLAPVLIPKHRSRYVLDFTMVVLPYARNQNQSYLFFQ